SAGLTAGSRIGHIRKFLWIAVLIHTDRIEQWIRNTQIELFIEPRLHQLDAGFEVVPAARIRDISLETVICQVALLRQSSGRIVKRIAARIVINVVSPNERIDRQKRMGAESVLVTVSDIDRGHILPLILAEMDIRI